MNYIFFGTTVKVAAVVKEVAPPGREGAREEWAVSVLTGKSTILVAFSYKKRADSSIQNACWGCDIVHKIIGIK